MSNIPYWSSVACAVTVAVAKNDYTILVPLTMGILPRIVDSVKEIWPDVIKDSVYVKKHSNRMVQPKKKESIEEEKNPPPIPPIVEELFDKGVKKGENLEQLLDNYNCEELESLKEAFENFGNEKEPPHENGSLWNNIKESFNSTATKINAYFEDHYMGFLIAFGSIFAIIVAIIIGLSISMMQNENDIEPFDTVGIELTKFGNDAMEAFYEASMELKKVGNQVVEAFNTASEELRFTNNATEIFNEVNKEMMKFGNDAAEAFNDVGVELQKLSNDAIESINMALEKGGNDAKETSGFDIPIDEPMILGNDAMEAFITGSGKLHFFGNEAIEIINKACGKIENFYYSDIEAFEAASMEFQIKLKITFE